MQRIRELDSVKYELGSNVSGKSFKSAISTSQSSSSKKSDSSRISNVAAKKAALKTKLKYIDIESKCLAELQKIKTIEEIEMVGAELEALEDPGSYEPPVPKPHLKTMKTVKGFCKPLP